MRTIDSQWRTVQVFGLLALSFITLLLQSLGTFRALHYGTDRKVSGGAGRQYCEYAAFTSTRILQD